MAINIELIKSLNGRSDKVKVISHLIKVTEA